jgi:hypothetical protein
MDLNEVPAALDAKMRITLNHLVDGKETPLPNLPLIGDNNHLLFTELPAGDYTIRVSGNGWRRVAAGDITPLPGIEYDTHLGYAETRELRLGIRRG